MTVLNVPMKCDQAPFITSRVIYRSDKGNQFAGGAIEQSGHSGQGEVS